MQYVRTNLSHGFGNLVYRLYQDGKFQKEKVVYKNKIGDYEEFLEKNGWERAYTEEEIKEMEGDIRRTKDKLDDLENLFKAAKEKMI